MRPTSRRWEQAPPHDTDYGGGTGGAWATAAALSLLDPPVVALPCSDPLAAALPRLDPQAGALPHPDPSAAALPVPPHRDRRRTTSTVAAKV